MNRNEFMEILEKSLNSITQADRNDILYDYREHFNAGLAEGKTEEEICLDLGDPEAIALQYSSEYGETARTNTEDKIHTGNAAGEIKEKVKSVSGKINEEKTETISGINLIKVEAAGIDNINLITGDSSELKAHLYGDCSTVNLHSEPEFSIKTKGDALEVRVKYPGICGISSSINLNLDIYLPSAYTGSLHVNTFSTDVNVNQISLESLICRTSSGNMIAGHVNINKAEFETKSGNTEINGSFGAFNFTSTSGDFKSDNITANNAALKANSGNITAHITADSLELQSTSGDITLSSDSKTAKFASVKTNSGNICLNITAESLELQSSSGDITADPVASKSTKLSINSGNATLKGNPGNVDAVSSSGDISLEFGKFENIINARNGSGNIDIKLPQDSEFALKFKTGSGDSRCDFPIAASGIQDEKSIEGVVGSNRNSITVSSGSGDLSILSGA